MAIKVNAEQSDTRVQPAPEQQGTRQAGHTAPGAAAAPAVAHALDGSQYHNIIEEQYYSELPPTAEEQRPWRIFHRGEAGEEHRPAQAAPAISVGTK